jgi:hypothetical protein
MSSHCFFKKKIGIVQSWFLWIVSMETCIDLEHVVVDQGNARVITQWPAIVNVLTSNMLWLTKEMHK